MSSNSRFNLQILPTKFGWYFSWRVFHASSTESEPYTMCNATCRYSCRSAISMLSQPDVPSQPRVHIFQRRSCRFRFLRPQPALPKPCCAVSPTIWIILCLLQGFCTSLCTPISPRRGLHGLRGHCSLCCRHPHQGALNYHLVESQHLGFLPLLVRSFINVLRIASSGLSVLDVNNTPGVPKYNDDDVFFALFLFPILNVCASALHIQVYF